MLWQARTTETSIKAPKKFRNHYALAGADTGDKTIEQLEELQRKKEPFISGYLYKRMDLKYDPSLLMEEPRHFGELRFEMPIVRPARAGHQAHPSQRKDYH